MQQKLEKGQQQTQRILDSIPDIVMVLDDQMQIQTVNAGFSRLTGLSPSQARGQLCYDVLCRRLAPPGSADGGCPARQVFETGRRIELVRVSDHVRVPGIEQYFDVTMIPLEKEDGRVTRVVETLHPINERVRLQREVEEAALRFRQFIQDDAHRSGAQLCGHCGPGERSRTAGGGRLPGAREHLSAAADR